MDHPQQRTYYIVFGVLLGLLVATVVAAEVKLGAIGFLVAILIASVKALLILLYFMHVRYSRPLTWIVAGAAFFWMAILFGLTLSDYETRDVLNPNRDGVRASTSNSFDAKTQR
jgi:cytochrome c oxidase subunit 4